MQGQCKAVAIGKAVERTAYKFWLGLPDGKTPLGRRVWKNKIEMDRNEIKLERADSICLACNMMQVLSSCGLDSETWGSVN